MDTSPVKNKTVRAKRYAIGLAAFAAAAIAPGLASAQAVDWQVGLQEAVSPVMEGITGFTNGTLILVTIIALFVLALLALAIIRFRAKVHPVPSKTTHNTVIEVVWTIVPVLILVGIAIPSFGLLFDQYDPSRVVEDYDPEEALNVKITGIQWSWGYEYPDERYDIGFYVSGPAGDAADNYEGAEPRLLEATLPMVVPVDTVVRLQVTAIDVLHSFAMPSMGVKVDAVPGRITESWFLAEREGTFYGQCSELCGKLHYAMPIELRVVSADQFEEWASVAASGDMAAAKELLDAWEAERLDQVAAR